MIERRTHAATDCGRQIHASSSSDALAGRSSSDEHDEAIDRRAETRATVCPDTAVAHVTLVTVEPSGIELSVEPGETLMNCAVRHGYYWPNVCGGIGSCGTCFAVIVSSTGGLPPPSAIEEVGRRMVAIGDERQSIRLACQMRPVGHVVVYKTGVRPLL
ncbi:hypothetical protein MMOR_56480 [Mycolicibacterium moriokaense]|uniref:2Fe-2S ferredoxin-type domain-containing protein n=1 Tax=Mycolicibacterium moriokaense TaxID=39691 RepID=A0AAD1M897_9MYCO|nr:hypothetical protein MMOR_56480 [Mycolicibacterium moriokaense]